MIFTYIAVLSLFIVTSFAGDDPDKYLSFAVINGTLVGPNGLRISLLDSNNKEVGNGDDDRLSGLSSGSGESFDTILSLTIPTSKDAQERNKVSKSAEVDTRNCCCSWFFCQTKK